MKCLLISLIPLGDCDEPLLSFWKKIESCYVQRSCSLKFILDLQELNIKSSVSFEEKFMINLKSFITSNELQNALFSNIFEIFVSLST